MFKSNKLDYAGIPSKLHVLLDMIGHYEQVYALAAYSRVMRVTLAGNYWARTCGPPSCRWQ